LGFDAVAGVELNGSTCAPNWLSSDVNAPARYVTGPAKARYTYRRCWRSATSRRKNAEMPAKQAGG
jgi:hypothetical protein